MPSSKIIPRIVLTPGEPSGIGPDLCLQLLQKQQACQLVIIANQEMLEARAERLKLPIKFTEFRANETVKIEDPGICNIISVPMQVSCEVGKPNVLNSRYVLKTLSRAAKACMEGVFDAMVTGPVHKATINNAGIDFTGHTEYIANLTEGYPVMMLATSGLRVALVTTHMPLSKVSQAITHNRLRQVVRILHQGLKDQFGIKSPRILVCGLNPHAGEEGHLGTEEIEIITPVLTAMRKQGMDLVGPLPADTIFTPNYLQSADAVLAMYHDQGLPVLKHIGFSQAANITLGLPIIRTSVDHGTALELAGTGKANVGSLEYAIKIAQEMAEQKKVSSIP